MSVLKIRDENGNFIPISTIKGEKGDTGEKGDVGYTPQKGVDYFTEEDIEYIITEVLSRIPSSEGVDY